MIPGKTRTCPHCKATILDSAAVCPACQHHLRFDPAAQRMVPVSTPLQVEGTIRHPTADGETWEYSIILSVRNERGEELTRQVAGVGALAPADARSFNLSVELFAPQAAAPRDVRTEPRAVPAAAVATPTAPPSIPRDPRPPARESQVRILPAKVQPLSKNRPRD
jgi:hypothetical protein